MKKTAAPKPTAASQKSGGGPAGALIVLAVALAYADSFAGRFFYDDNTSLIANASLRRLWPPWVPLLPPPQVTTGGRPLANLTFAINYALGRFQPAGYHAVNLLIHIGAALALYGVARHIFRSPVLAKRFAGSETLAAAMVALLWALHPLQTEAVTYVVQRVESLMGLFFLLTLYGFVRYAEEPARTRWWWLSLGACILGAATKEVIALAPVMALLGDRAFYAGSFREAWRRRWKIHLSLMATWLLLVLMVASAGWNRGGSAGFDIGVKPTAYWLTQFKAVATYLRLCLWPHPLSFDYGSFWSSPARALPYAAVVVPLALATLAALRFRPAWGFLGGWFFGILAPTCLMPGSYQMIVEHRMYLSLAAVAAATVVLCHHFWGRRGLFALAPVAAALGILTYLRNANYRSDLDMWTETVAASPQNSRAWNALGNAYLGQGQLEEAARCYRDAIRITPNSMEAHLNLGSVLLGTGHAADAIAECSAAVSLKPGQAMAHTRLGDALMATGRFPQAAEQYRQALHLSPGSATALIGLGRLQLRQGDVGGALATLEQAVAAAPGNPSAQFALGNALLQSGRWTEAAASYRTVLAAQPDNTDAWNNLGNALLRGGFPNDASDAFAQAARLNRLLSERGRQ